MGPSPATTGPRAKNKRRAVPYNEHVARARQEKYYERKKTLSKFKRLQKYEEKQQLAKSGGSADSENTFLGKLLAEGADKLSEDYEQRLEHAFGGSKEDGPKLLGKRKKTRKASSLNEEPAAEADAAAQELQPRARRKKLKVSKEATEAISSGTVRTADSDDKQVRPLKYRADAGELGRGRQASGRGKGRGRGAGKDRPVPVRYAKELREYQQAKEAAQAEKQRRLDEMREKSRRKRENAKGRALKGQRLAQRNSKGQPKMQNVLAELAAKLARERAPEAKGR